MTDYGGYSLSFNPYDTASHITDIKNKSDVANTDSRALYTENKSMLLNSLIGNAHDAIIQIQMGFQYGGSLTDIVSPSFVRGLGVIFILLSLCIITTMLLRQ